MRDRIPLLFGRNYIDEYIAVIHHVGSRLFKTCLRPCDLVPWTTSMRMLSSLSFIRAYLEVSPVLEQRLLVHGDAVFIHDRSERTIGHFLGALKTFAALVASSEPVSVFFLEHNDDSRALPPSSTLSARPLWNLPHFLRFSLLPTVAVSAGMAKRTVTAK